MKQESYIKAFGSFGIAVIGVIVFASMILGPPPVQAQQDTGVVTRQLVITSQDISNTSFEFCESGGPENGLNCSTGSGDDDGWITSNGASPKAFQVEIDTINATSLDFIIEARLFGAENQAAKIWPSSAQHSETATGSFIVQVPDWVYQVRMGYKITTDGGAQDVDIVYNQFGAR